MFATTALMFLGTAISIFMTLDFLRPMHHSSPF
jgi:hypothetical protein